MDDDESKSSLKIQLKLTKQDFIKFEQYSIFDNEVSGLIDATNYLATMCLWWVIGMVIMTIYYGFKGAFEQSWIIAVLICTVPFFIYVYIGKLQKSYCLKALSPSENGLILGTKEVSLSSEGIDVKSERVHSVYPWSSVEEVVENDGDIYVFVDNIAAIIFASRNFQNAESRQQIIEYLNLHSNK